MEFDRILVTGCSGFAGRWVIAELRRRFPNAGVFGAFRTERGPVLDLPLDGRLRLDLSDSNSIRNTVEKVRPDAVVHLASINRGSLDDLLAVNVTGFERLLDCLNDTVLDSRIVVVGSSAELGRAGACDVSLSEDAVCEPVDSYGVTKLAQSAIAYAHALKGQQIVRLRAFNLIGPGMPGDRLPGRCVCLLREALHATKPIRLEFGALYTRRDYVDVRDLARAIVLALSRAKTGALYHIGSGESHSGRELVDSLIKISQVAEVSYVERDNPAAVLVPFQTADTRRAHAELSWQTEIDWTRSLQDLWGTASSPMDSQLRGPGAPMALRR